LLASLNYAVRPVLHRPDRPKPNCRLHPMHDFYVCIRATGLEAETTPKPPRSGILLATP